MESPRKSGALLFLGGLLTFAGINAQLLPPQTFFVGLVMAPVGFLLFMKGNRVALEQAEERARRAVAEPTIRSVTADAFADQQARQFEAQAAERQAVDARAARAEPVEPERDAIELDDDDEEFAISTDVSFPVEVQERGVLADEIRKLQRLREDGVIDDSEFAAAKAKLLR